MRYRAAEVERLIIALVAEDLSNQQIALKLGLSGHTVRNYVHRLLLRYGAQSRSGLVLAALKTGDLNLRDVVSTREALTWWTTPLGVTIGVVALVDSEHGYWKAYIGTASGLDLAADIQTIIETGTHVGPEVAQALAGKRYAALRFQAA